MIIDLTKLSSGTQAWVTDPGEADVTVTSDGTTRTLTGMGAAAFLFGQSLSTVQFQGTLDGVQLTDGRFEFPPSSGQWVSLSEVADALKYKYGVDPLIEFAPGLGLRGYSVADINGILDLLNREFRDQFSFALLSSSTVQVATQLIFDAEKAAVPGSTATYDASSVSSLLDSASRSAQGSATEAELRKYLTDGGDLYTDRLGRFFVNGIHTAAMDVAVVSRLLVHDNIASEYQVLMDEYAQRNNMIAQARAVIDGGIDGLSSAVESIQLQYGTSDPISELSAGQYTHDSFFWKSDASANTLTIDTDIDPAWRTGMRVQVNTSGGGLTAGTDYYVRNLGSGAYGFFTSRSDAVNDTGRCDLSATVPKSIQLHAMDSSVYSVGGSGWVSFNPGLPTNGQQNYDLLAHAQYVDEGDSQTKDNYLKFFPINPGWPEDTALEVTQGGNGLTAGPQLYVANLYDSNGALKGVQLTSSAGGSANTNDNLITGVPNGQIMLYDGGSVPGAESWTGYNQFTLPGTEFTTGTRFRVDRPVDLLMTHTHDGHTYYKSVEALHTGRDYYLRSEGNGAYSVYDTAAQSAAGGETGRYYFAMSDGTFTGETNGNYVTEATATVRGLSDSGIQVFGGRTSVGFDVDPWWLDATAVQVRTTGGGLTAGVNYYTKAIGYGFFMLYTDATLQNAVTFYSPLNADFFRPIDDSFATASDPSPEFDKLTALLNTLISNKVRDGDLDQSKLQTLTAQLQNNTEAMTALIKAFADLNLQLVRAL
jgi:hypothetical protein